MKIINDIIYLMYKKWDFGCPSVPCQLCHKNAFCWCEVFEIACEYIEREGTI